MSWLKTSRIVESFNGTVCNSRSYNPPGKIAVVKSTKLSDNAKDSSLISEAKIFRRLQQPHGSPFIVRCYGVDTSVEGGEETHNVFFERAPGGTLANVISSYAPGEFMSENQLADYTCMLLRGIFHAHRKHVFHGEINPRNILVFFTKDGRDHLKLSEFGKAVKKDGAHRRAMDIHALGQTVVEMMNGGAYQSELLHDFLKLCFEPDPERLWTAEMLLNHKFIVRKVSRGFLLAPGFETSNLIPAEKPFESDWIEEKYMFSGGIDTAGLELIPPSALAPYELFPRDDSRKTNFHLFFDNLRQSLNRDGQVRGLYY